MTLPLGNRGYSRLLRMRPQDGVGVYRLGRHSFFFHRDDEYWAPLRSRLFQYEPEIAMAIRERRDPETTFIDGGANIGFWSVFASEMGFQEIVAIEPNPAHRELLQANLHDLERVKLVFGALTALPNKTVKLTVPPSDVAGAFVVKQNEACATSVRVRNINIDRIIETALSRSERVLMKLDIEGSESSVAAASRFLRHPSICWIYEDHAKDQSHAATRVFLDTGLHQVFFLGDSRRRPRRIQSLAQLNQIKSVAHRGYNFLASIQG